MGFKKGLLIFIWLLPAVCLGQYAELGITVELQHYPEFQLNRHSIGSATPLTIGISGYSIDSAPLEYSAHLSLGYSSDVSFAYGLSLALVEKSSQKNLLKAGIQLDRIRMSHYRSDAYAGGIREDEVHDSIQPFIEWEHRIAEQFAVSLNVGYRLLRSDTEYLTELVDQRELSDGGMAYKFKAIHKQHYYGAGLQLGAGLHVYF